MPKYVAPDVDKWEWTCPLCETLVRQHWRKVYVDGNLSDDEPQLDSRVRRCRCGACEQISWWIDGAMVSPRVGLAKPPHLEMPDDVRGLYEEARGVFDVSPRSAAALLRTALETLTRVHLKQGDKLNDAIGNLVRAGRLDVDVQQAMDVLRLTGNGAVHPMMLQLDDDAADASALFELLNLVVERLVAQPRRVQEIYNSLPETKRAQIEKRDAP